MNNPQEIFIKVPESDNTYFVCSPPDYWLRPLTAHVFTTEQLQERDREIAGKAFDAAHEMDYGSLPPIPDWIIRYDQADHQSSAGKAIRFLMQRIKELERGRQ